MIPYDVWAEIDLTAIAENVRKIKSCLTEGSRLMAVVKADAYGHGAVRVSRQVLAAGADALGVARIGEAIELRQAGIDAPILIFGRTAPAMAQKLAQHNLTQTVSSYKDAADLSGRAQGMGVPIRVHINIDTGMGRLGVLGIAPGGGVGFDDAAEEVAAICGLRGLDAEGVYTHFATADCCDKHNAREQFERFTQILTNLRDRGIAFAVCHAANSAAVIDMPETHMDMVRPGISIYGHYPSDEVDRSRVDLVPAMAVKARIVHLKKVGPGFKVSYGWTAQTVKETTIATVSVGYADGFCRLLSSTGKMLIHGKAAPVIGRVCMDNTMLDVGHIPGVACGDAALIFGRSPDGGIPVEAIAREIGTINYEVLTRISARVPRVYHVVVS